VHESPGPKASASRGCIDLPPFLATLYQALLDDCWHRYVFTGACGAVLRRSNFTRRLWRPTWDGDPHSADLALRPPILEGFTFHGGCHTHRTWLADDLIPEIARAVRLGHRLQGMGEVYEHVTPQMRRRVARRSGGRARSAGSAPRNNRFCWRSFQRSFAHRSPGVTSSGSGSPAR
jgi:integrase